MNAITMVEPTIISTEEDAVSRQAGPTVRVALREIREYAYRALVVSGASPGEAAAAADQVLHAEVHAREGLTCLVADLARGTWPRAGLGCTRGSGPRPVLEVSCGERSGELRLGAALVDLAAGEEGPAVITTGADVEVTSLLDAALLTGASTSGTTIAAMRRAPNGHGVVRLATRDGDLAWGPLDPHAASVLAGRGGLDGLVVLTGVQIEDRLRTQLTWSGAAQRAAQRREAALRGIEVDAATWRTVADQAQHFLVPERDA